MPKYKVGDVAALFPKPKESTTESGKKLQSLFNEIKRNLSNQSSQDYPKSDKKLKTKNEDTGDESKFTRNKKRKISNSLKSDVTNFNKKLKQSNDYEKIASCSKEDKVMKSSLPEISFPRRKKYNKSFNSANSKSNNMETENSADKPLFTENKSFKFKSSQKNKQISSFIKKSKLNKMKDNNVNTENSVTKNITDGHDSLSLKNDDLKQRINTKKARGKKSHNSVQTSDLSKSFKHQATYPNEPDFIHLTQTTKQETKDNSKIQKSETENFVQEKTDSSVKQLEEEVLGRTLFIGNLPTDTTIKALKKFFGKFGSIESIRYHRIETDRNKIYKHGGLNLQNLKYAAESIPGFIVYKERQSAIDALILSGSVFENRHITVDFARAPGCKKLYDEKRSIFIGNLPFDIQDETIWDTFAEHGKIESVRIVRDKKTGIGKGFGYVQFSSVQAKKNALALKNLEIEKRPIRIKAVNSKQEQKKTSMNKKFSNKDSFKSRAINYKKTHKDTCRRKSVKKIMKKEKDLHKKKKIASLLTKSMKI